MKMDGIHKSILLWGVLCLIGFGAYHFPTFGRDVMQPMPFWTVLTVIGVIGMIKWVPAWQKNKVVHVWLVVGVLGMLYHWAFFSGVVPALIPSAWAYWALLMAAGFVATGHFWKDNYWYYIGALNALAFVAVFFFSAAVGMNGSALLALVSGLPLIYYGAANKMA